MTKMVSSLPALDNCRLEGSEAQIRGDHLEPSQNLAKALECISARFRAHQKSPVSGAFCEADEGTETTGAVRSGQTTPLCG
jgi:hypothetical protein